MTACPFALRSLALPQHAAPCERAHEMACAEGPGRRLTRQNHAVGETAELRRCNRDDIADLVGEALAFDVAVLDRGEQRAEKQHRTVRILMIETDHLRDEIGGIAASGPIPTSRYCDHMPFSMRSALSFIAASEPGLSFDRSSPMRDLISLRIAGAAAGLPRARSSITRSSIEIAKVTPAALIA